MIAIRYQELDETIVYAANELARCLRVATGQDVEIQCETDLDHEGPGLRLGTAQAISGLSLQEVADPVVDDAIHIDVRGGQGVIAGNNRRSVLLAAYRYLHELGCRWVRPGADGELIPSIDLDTSSVSVSESAAHRHRLMVIEGAISREHLLDMIEWCPRVGYNGYVFQFHDGHTFFRRWYEHIDNPIRQAEDFDREVSDRYTEEAICEIKKRGLLLHSMGHGWTTRALGMDTRGWDKYDGALSEQQTSLLAELNGERQLHRGVPLSSNLCYSNPEARSRMVHSIVEYAQANPHVNYLNFYIADDSNNTCECSECRKRLPSDYYVMMLNELDIALSSEGLETRIVFLIYVDLLWPPQEERIANPERFTIMFAPITRTFSKSFAQVREEEIPALPEYNRNDIHVKGGNPVEENLVFLREWQKTFAGDGFDFDYHYWQFQFDDPAGMQMAEVAHDDIRAMRRIGLHGYAGCQTQRAAFPTALGPWVIAKALWRGESSFDELAEDYFASAFGTEGDAVREYLVELSRLFRPSYFRGEESVESKEAFAAFSSIDGVIDAFAPSIDAHVSMDVPRHAASWRYLERHAQICRLLAEMLRLRAGGDQKGVGAVWERLRTEIWQMEEHVHPVLDVWLFVCHMQARFAVSHKATTVEP